VSVCSVLCFYNQNIRRSTSDPRRFSRLSRATQLALRLFCHVGPAGLVAAGSYNPLIIWLCPLENGITKRRWKQALVASFHACKLFYGERRVISCIQKPTWKEDKLWSGLPNPSTGNEASLESLALKSKPKGHPTTFTCSIVTLKATDHHSFTRAGRVSRPGVTTTSFHADLVAHDASHPSLPFVALSCPNLIFQILLGNPIYCGASRHEVRFLVV
jgi:hypothetical protein